MKFILTLLLSIFVFANSIAQVTVHLRSGDFVNTNPEKNPNNDAASFADCIYDGNYFLWLQFNELPTEAKTKTLLETGVKLYDYLPRNSYIASFPVGYNFSILKQYDVYAVTKPLAAAKIDVSLYNPSQISWAVAANGNLKANVSFTNYVTQNIFMSSLKNNGIIVSKIGSELDEIVVVEASIIELKKIAAHPLVQYIEPSTHPAVIEDIQGVSNHRITAVQSSDNWITGKKLNGAGVSIAIGDDGYIGPHIDFQGRIVLNASNTAAANTHSDHCSGIITGAGNLNPQVRGQAPGADLYVYDSYAPYNLFPSIYNNDQVRIVSHSLGQSCNAGYDANARTSDQLIRTYPQLMYVHSAGNSGTSNCGGLSGWRNITGGFKAGKNVMTVANLTKADVADNSSSRGPMSDGRIKPDIAAVGANVNSTQPDNTFDVFSGTSMACPAVAGNLAVLYQAYKEKNSGSQPEGNLMKAIALNTADDMGNEGPDFIYGWGRINIRKAVNCVENVRYFTDNITTGVTKTHTINIPANVARAKIMIYWGDREANAGAAKSLVNNINTKITANAVDYLPWVLDIGAVPDESTISSPAVKGVDSVNNMEQIQLDNPTAGAYTLSVNGKAIPFGPSKYYVVYEFAYTDEIVVTYPFGGESFSTNETQRLRWDATENVGNFKIEYTINDGTTWTTITTAVAGDRRYYDWSVPSTASSKAARIRVSRNTGSDVSDTTFVILRVPSGITFTTICQGTSKISWNTVSGATGYDVFRLGSKYMEQVATTTLTNVILSDLGDTINWFAVRAKMAASQANGRRSNAVSHTNSSVVVCPVPVKLISFIASVKNNIVQLDWTVANEDGMLSYVVEKSASPNFENTETVGQLKPTNKLTTQQYQLFDKNIKTAAIWYYRLKMVEAGKSLYSNVQAVRIDKPNNTAFLINPNPVVNSINFTSQMELANGVIKLYNELGKEVMIKNISNIKIGEKYVIQTNGLSTGNYFVSVIDKENSAVIFKQQITIIK